MRPVRQPLRLLHPAQVPGSAGPRSPRIPIGHAIGLVACAGIPSFWAALFLTSDVRIAPLGWVLLPLAALVLLTVCFAIGLGCFEHLRAALKAGNWLARACDDGVHLHYRSWLNWRFPTNVPTVAFVPYEAIASVHEVRETFVAQLLRTRTQRYHAYTVLRLHPGSDTTELDRAVRRELSNVPPRTGFIASHRAWDDAPVFVRRPGEIWIEWRSRRLLSAIARHVPEGPRESLHTPGDAIVASGDADAIRRHALDVLFHGRRSDAVRVLRAAFGLALDEAHRALVELLEPEPPGADDTQSERSSVGA